MIIFYPSLSAQNAAAPILWRNWFLARSPWLLVWKNIPPLEELLQFCSLAITKIQLFIEKLLFLPYYFGVGNF